ncbi:MAG: LysM peptidoglycan-binding domain-containing protein [Bacteroidota bacterium]
MKLMLTPLTRLVFPCLLLAFSLPCNPVSAETDTSAGSQQTPVFYADPVSVIPVQEGEVKAGLLYDAVNKKVVWQKNATAVLPIASLTKMMVALLAVEDIRAGKFNWTDTVEWVRRYAVGRRSRRRVVNAPAVYTLQDVFKATMIASNNECAEQMARYIGNGDLNATIQRMNRRAWELGMNSTIYRNPSGLPASHPSLDNASSPVDQLILGLELLKYDEVLEITGMGYAQVNNGRTPSIIRNHNGLTIQHAGDVDGLKTGYTRRAGFCLVGTTEKCGHRLISVVLGCRGPQIRNEVVRNMFNAYYTSIGLDPIGNYCPAPYNLAAIPNTGDSSFSTAGQWVSIREKVKDHYVVRNGESLSRIAQKNHCTTSQLRSWNKRRIPSSGTIYAGQTLAVYRTTTRKVWIAKPDNGSEVEEDTQTADANGTEQKTIEQLSSPPVPALETATVYHTVQAGDTLYSIARKYGVASIDQIKSLNNIRDSRSIRPGMKLRVKVDG